MMRIRRGNDTLLIETLMMSPYIERERGDFLRLSNQIIIFFFIIRNDFA